MSKQAAIKSGLLTKNGNLTPKGRLVQRVAGSPDADAKLKLFEAGLIDENGKLTEKGRRQAEKNDAHLLDLKKALEALPEALAKAMTSAMLQAVQTATSALPRPVVNVEAPTGPAPIINSPPIELSPVIHTTNPDLVQVVRITDRDQNGNLREFEIKTK